MSLTINGDAIDILLVEDNPGDAQLTLEALAESKILNRLHHAWDGVEAIRFLKGEVKDAPFSRPDLILLDLNLPRKSGHEVLAELKADPNLRQIPVVILTTSKAEEDILRSYDLHANCYVTKPVDLDRFLEVVRLIEDFWLTIVRLPPHKRGRG